MNRNISEAHKAEYNPLYYSVDSTKAAIAAKGTFMKPPDYSELKQFIEQESTCPYIALDSLLSKLDNQNLRDLKEILKDFFEAGKEDEICDDRYDEGYSDGYEDAKELYLYDED